MSLPSKKSSKNAAPSSGGFMNDGSTPVHSASDNFESEDDDAKTSPAELKRRLKAATKRFFALNQGRKAGGASSSSSSSSFSSASASASAMRQPESSKAHASEFLAAAAALVKAQSEVKLAQAQKAVSDAITAEDGDVKVERAEMAVEHVESSTKSLCNRIELMRYKIRMSDAEAELVKAQQACHQAELAQALMETSLLQDVFDSDEQKKKDAEAEFKKAKARIAKARTAVQRIYDEM